MILEGPSPAGPGPGPGPDAGFSPVPRRPEGSCAGPGAQTPARSRADRGLESRSDAKTACIEPNAY